MTAPIFGVTITTVSSLPASGYTGQLVVLSTDGHLYSWDGLAWVDTGSGGGGGGATAREIRVGVFYAP